MSDVYSYPSECYVSTSISKKIMRSIDAVHRRRRIAVIAGPPGIGKSETIKAFKNCFPDEVAIVKVSNGNASPTTTMRYVASAVQGLVQDDTVGWMPNGTFELQRKIFAAVCARAGLSPSFARRGLYDVSSFGSLTLIIDEAQNLSRAAIEQLRFWNDPDNCYGPMPFGRVFIGNSEFMLERRGGNESVLSAAVADRAIVIDEYGYEDVVDDDLVLYAESRGVIDDSAIESILGHFRNGPNPVRSLRRLRDAIDASIEEVGNRSITADTLLLNLR